MGEYLDVARHAWRRLHAPPGMSILWQMPAHTLSARYRKALVTGASSGLGLAFARMLLDEGLTVVATSRDPARLPRHERLVPEALDLLDEASFEAFLKRLEAAHPDIDLVVNNAGAGAFYPVTNFPPAKLEAQLALLLVRPVVLARTLYPRLVEKQGALVNVSSLAADFPLPFMSGYNAGKAGLSGFTRSLHLEARASRSPLLIIDLRPGDYRTDFNRALDASPARADAVLAGALENLEKNLRSGPPPEHAAHALRRLLLRGKSGSYACGGFFQARLAPPLGRVLSWNQLVGHLLRYFGLAGQSSCRTARRTGQLRGDS